MSKAIVVGQTTFRDTVMDYNPIFRVVENLKNGTYRAVSEDEDGYGGVERFYSRAQVLQRVRHEEAIQGLFKSQDSYWASRNIGEVLHYCNGGEEFIRGVVVEINGEKKLKPTAMVGVWRASDLPKRRPNGEIYYGYHAKKIIEGGEDACWQPSMTCVYEAPGSSFPQRCKLDPRKLDPIDLSVPDMTPDELTTARLEQVIDRVRNILEMRYQTSAHPRAVIDHIKEVVDSVSTPPA